MTKRTKRNKEQALTIIGMETTYIGHERRHGGHGAKMRIIGILRYDAPEDSVDGYIVNNDHLARLGGIRPQDGAEVHTWLPSENRWSFVANELTSVMDLEGIVDLLQAPKE